MDEEHHPQTGWVRLPAYDGEGDSARGSGPVRASGVSWARRASNWTAAALIAGVAAAVGYFAHHTQAAVPTATVTPGAPGSVSTASPGKPALTSPVVTSRGSAVSQGDDRRDN
jgi:hypothetical protein